jgi:undecaprenyl diphosphate synthase
LRRVIEHAPDCGVGRLTLYAFSCDNWNRPVEEVRSIFHLMRAYLHRETGALVERGARLEVIGRRDRLPRPLLRAIERAEGATARGRRLHVRVAVDYSSRDAIARAAAAIHACGADRPYSADRLHARLAEALTADSGEVDLLIRTGGEKRLSDFLLWESAYAELFFTDRMWPDFATADLDAALREFRARERRFGRLSPACWQCVPPSIGGMR